MYFNIVRSIKQILGTLAAYDDVDDGSDADSILEVDVDDGGSIINGSLGKRKGKATAFTNIPSTPVASTSASIPTTPTTPTAKSSRPIASSSQSPQQPSTQQIANLRLRLSPLVAVEELLATRLTGGVAVCGSGKGEVFVRSGWQTRTVENGGLIKGRRSKKSIRRASRDTNNGRVSAVDGSLLEEDPLLDDIANMLESSKDDIKDLWDHPTVVTLIATRKLKLNEWSEL